MNILGSSTDFDETHAMNSLWLLDNSIGNDNITSDCRSMLFCKGQNHRTFAHHRRIRNFHDHGVLNLAGVTKGLRERGKDLSKRRETLGRNDFFVMISLYLLSKLGG